MGKSKRPPRGPGFVMIYWNLLNSKAYIDLPYAASKALPYFLGKVKLKNTDPQRLLEEFHFSYREGKRLRFSFSTFSKVIQYLVYYGFIEPVDKGGLRGDCKSYNIFKLSMRWQDYGTEKEKVVDWKCFFPREKQKQLQKVKRTTPENEISTHV